MRVKKLISLTLALAMVVTLFSTTVAAQEAQDATQQAKPVKVYYQGKLMDFSVDPIVEYGVTFVQFRPIFEKLGLEIEWDQATQGIIASNSKLKLEMAIDNQQVFVNGENRYIDSPPRLVKSHTMVPLRFVSEVSGKEVVWDEKTRTININSGYELDTNVQNPYASDSYLTLQAQQDHEGIQPNIHYKNDMLYVSWYKDVDFTSNDVAYSFRQFYVSVAKDGKWIKRADLAYTYMRFPEAADTSQVLFLNGDYFVTDQGAIHKISFDDKGVMTSELFAGYLPYSEDQAPTYTPVYMNGETALLYKGLYNDDTHNLTYYRLYYDGGEEDMNNYYTVKDFYGVLENVSQSTTLVFDKATKILYLIEGDTYRQLNTETGDLKYGSDGQDLVLPLVTGMRTGTGKLFITDGKLGLLYMNETDTTYRFTTLSNSLKAGDSVFTHVTSEHTNNTLIAQKNNKLYFFSLYEFNRKPSIQLVRYSYQR